MLKYQRSPNTFSLHLGRNPSEYFPLDTVLLLSHNFSLKNCYIAFPHNPSPIRSFSQQFSKLVRAKKAREAFSIYFHPQSISELFTGSSFAQRLSGPCFPCDIYSLPDDTLHMK